VSSCLSIRLNHAENVSSPKAANQHARVASRQRSKRRPFRPPTIWNRRLCEVACQAITLPLSAGARLLPPWVPCKWNFAKTLPGFSGKRDLSFLNRTGREADPGFSNLNGCPDAEKREGRHKQQNREQPNIDGISRIARSPTVFFAKNVRSTLTETDCLRH
jgi:hypothetical protein